MGNFGHRYVRITLPEGVRQEGSEFQLLQAQFEKILIDHGLLKPGETPNERSVTIPDTSAIHILGDAAVVLAKGDLTLSTVKYIEREARQRPSSRPDAARRRYRLPIA